MTSGIRGITRTSLWNAWKAVRMQLKKASIRDVVDHLEYDIDPDKWINRVIHDIAAGTYEPASPRRYLLAKSKWFSRRMTMPEIPDLVLYRAIANHLYRQVRRREHKHVYFEQASLSKITRTAEAEAAQLERTTAAYGPTSFSRFLAWLRFSQYRKRLIFDEVYPFIVTTDITNFFDTVLHARIADTLYGISAPPRMVGLLFFLLERLSIRHPYGESPRIGLPVDEFDCSRKLAHLFLFSHDDRMVRAIGEEAYVRWMDDQTIGVKSRAEALKLLALLGDSLASLHLTPNSTKTRLLSLAEARRHFHLDLNHLLDNAEKLREERPQDRRLLRSKVRAAWSRSRKYEGTGEWEKILSRVYKLAGLANLRMMRWRAIGDLIAHPQLSQRIAAYMRCTGSPAEFLAFAQSVWGHEEQPYGGVNYAIFEAMLRVEAEGVIAAKIRLLASVLLAGKLDIPGYPVCSTVAPLLILRFGDRRSLPRLRKCFSEDPARLGPDTVRASAIAYASYGLQEYEEVREAAGRMLRNPLAWIIRMIDAIRLYKDVPERWKVRFTCHYDPVAGNDFADMRGLLSARLLALNGRPNVLAWLKTRKEEFSKKSLTDYDRELLDRLLNV